MSGGKVKMVSKAPNPRTIVVDLLRAAAPERATERSAFLDEYEPRVEMTNDSAAEMKAGSTRIAFNGDMLDAVWLYTFSAWHAIETYTPTICTFRDKGVTVDQALRLDDGRGPLEQAYKARMAIAATYAQPAGPGGRA